MIGETAGSYRIVRQVGKGGMGAVYLGEHAMLGRLAAIKILLPALSQDREVVARFFNEARAATAIRHPGIVEIYDFGFLSDGAAFIAMEMLDGETVSARLRRLGRLPIEASLEIGRQVAAALQAAHHKGITHRDLKPDNVFLVNDPEIGERVKLLDFGIAKLVTEEAGNRTRTGVVMGTPMYMSPEQCRGATTLDSRADLYSLGCMLYELLSGRPPFVADSAGDIIAHHLYFQPEPVRLHEPSVPEPLEQLIMSLLAKEPAKRPASAADVAVILDRMRGAGIAQAVNAVALGMAATLPIVAPSAQHPAAKVATTISGSAAILPAASRSKGRWFAAAAVLVAAIGVGVTMLRGSESSPPVAVTAPAGEVVPVAPQGPSPGREPAPPAPGSNAAAPSGSPSESPSGSPSGSSSDSIDRVISALDPPPGGTAPPADVPSKPAEEPPARRSTRASGTRSSSASAKRPREVATAPPPREEPKPVESPAPRASEPAATVAAPDHAEPPPAKSPDSAPAPKADPKPAETAAAPAKPQGSKWAHLMGDKAPNADDFLLLEQCKAAARRGDCTAAKAFGAELAKKNIAMYRARAETDSAIAACLRSK